MNDWFSTHPFVFTLIPLIGGILFCYYTSFPVSLLRDTDIEYLDRTVISKVEITDYPVHLSNGKFRYEAIIHSWADSLNSHVTHDKVLLLFPDSIDTFNVGDILLTRLRVYRPQPGFPDYFDYGLYLRQQHIVGLGKVSCWRKEGNYHSRSLIILSRKVRHRLEKRYEELGINGEELSILKALTLGDKADLSKETRQSFASSGAAHVLAVSGLHTGILYGIIWFIFVQCIGKILYRIHYYFRTRRYDYSNVVYGDQSIWSFHPVSGITIILVLWIFAFISGLSPSVVRAVLMLTIMQIGKISNRIEVEYNSLAAAAFISLVVNPLSLFSVSFQLSFTAVWAIAFFGQRMKTLVESKNKIVQYIWSIIWMSISAQIGTMPITLYYFGQMSNYFLLTNLLVIPGVFIIVSGGLLSLICGPTFLGKGIGWLTAKLVFFLKKYVVFIEQLPGSTSHFVCDEWMILLLFVFIVCCGLAAMKNRFIWFAPATMSLLLFIGVHSQHLLQESKTEQIICEPTKVYYQHGKDIKEVYPIDGVLFYHYRDSTFAVKNIYYPDRKSKSLQSFSKKHHIVTQ